MLLLGLCGEGKVEQYVRRNTYFASWLHKEETRKALQGHYWSWPNLKKQTYKQQKILITKIFVCVFLEMYQTASSDLSTCHNISQELY